MAGNAALAGRRHRPAEVARILVDESGGWLKAFDEDDRLVALYSVTTGSENDPLPLGEWGVNGIAHNPPSA